LSLVVAAETNVSVGITKDNKYHPLSLSININKNNILDSV